MQNKTGILDLLYEYSQQYLSEQKEVQVIISFVDAHDDEEIINRKNFNGHITASAFIINEANDSLLLLKHKFLNRLLQPGGHVDASDASLVAAAQREATEETGLTEGNLKIVSEEIFDLDSHLIPENTKKQEARHFHHDVRFLFTAATDTICIADEESTGSRWVPLKDLMEDQTFGRVAKKILDKNELKKART